MSTPTSSTPAVSSYIPPPEMLAAAEHALATATPEELALAEVLYDEYAEVTGFRSAVTGAELPRYKDCRELVRAGWLASARAFAGRALCGKALLKTHFEQTYAVKVPTLAAIEDVGGMVDPFLLGIAEIATATQALAEASKAVPTDTGTIAELIEDTATALHARVKMLAQPSAPGAEA